MFQDNLTGKCIAYNYGTEIDPFFVTVYVCCAINVLCGVIITLWLLFSTCCPILVSHKLALIVLTIWACAFQAFAFLFFGNLICQENGCVLDQGGYIAIGAAAMYFITILTLLRIKPTDGSWVAQPADQWIEQKGTVDSEDEVMAPSIPAVIIGE